VCRRLRANPLTAGLPIVHVFALRISDSDLTESRLAGSDAYLINPVVPASLARVLDTLIEFRS
jgi:CheY-like chemotaxis protein